MKKLSKKDDFLRRWRSFRRHVWLCFQPFVVAIVMVMLWRWLWQNGYHLCKEDEVALTGGITAVLVLAYGITAALAFNSVWEKYRKVMACVLPHRPDDKRTFLLYRDEKLPVIIHLYLLFLSLLLLAMIMMINYKEELSGIMSIFSASFVITLYWVVMVQLENPAKSPWLAERVPKDWLEEDVDKFFKLENGE
jgi:hypothetical protein